MSFVIILCPVFCYIQYFYIVHHVQWLDFLKYVLSCLKFLIISLQSCHIVYHVNFCLWWKNILVILCMLLLLCFYCHSSNHLLFDIYQIYIWYWNANSKCAYGEQAYRQSHLINKKLWFIFLTIFPLIIFVWLI